MQDERSIKNAKYVIAYYENLIIECEQLLGGRGESSIIRYY